jgi:uncharacterized protein (DUF2384 family)
MTYEDNLSGRIEAERIDRLAEWLEMTLGTKVTAFAVGVSQNDICRIAHGEEDPGAEEEQRLRNLYEAAWTVAAHDGPGSAREWLCQPNPELDDRAPVEALRAGERPRQTWFRTSPAF